MGFLRSLFARPSPDREEPAARPEPPGRTSEHPNAPLQSVPDFGMPERHHWETPDGSVILNGKTWNQLRTVLIQTTISQAQLRSRVGQQTNKDISPIRLEVADGRVVVWHRDELLGALTGEAEGRIEPVVEDWTARGWQVWTWGKIDGMDGRRLRLVAVIPTPEEPLYAQAYDASFLFPWSKVKARRETLDGKAEYEEYVRRVEDNRPREVTLTFGAATIEAYLLDWGGSGAWERRGIQGLHPEFGTYVYDEDIGEKWPDVWATYLAGAEKNRDSSRSEFDVGRVVSLVPEPDNPYDRNTIAVRSADGRYKAGYIGREETVSVRRLAARGPVAAIVQWEQRQPGARTRQRLRLLLGPAPCQVLGRAGGVDVVEVDQRAAPEPAGRVAGLRSRTLTLHLVWENACR